MYRKSLSAKSRPLSSEDTFSASSEGSSEAFHRPPSGERISSPPSSADELSRGNAARRMNPSAVGRALPFSPDVAVRASAAGGGRRDEMMQKRGSGLSLGGGGNRRARGNHPFGVPSDEDDDEEGYHSSSKVSSRDGSGNYTMFSDDEDDYERMRRRRRHRRRKSRELPEHLRDVRRSSSLSPEAMMVGGGNKGGHSGRSDRSDASKKSTGSNASTGSNMSTSTFALSRNSQGSARAFPRPEGGGPGHHHSGSAPMHLTMDRNSGKMVLAAGAASSNSSRSSRGDAGVDGDGTPPMVASFDRLIGGPLRDYIRRSRNMDANTVGEQARIVESLFLVQREFLLSSCRNRTPSAGTGPTQANKIREIRDVAFKYKEEPYYPHLRFIGETIGAVGWIVVGKKPNAFIRESYDQGKSFVKDIKKFGASSPQPSVHADWVKSWQEVILELEEFVRRWHPYGLIWGKN